MKMNAPFPKAGIPSMMGDVGGGGNGGLGGPGGPGGINAAQQAQLSEALNNMSDADLLQMINSNPEIKKQYDELMKKHAKENPAGAGSSKPVTSAEYLKIEKDIEKYLDKEGGIVIEPTPRLVIKTQEVKTKEKFFINVLTHPLIDVPEEKFLVDYENQPGLRVPMSLGKIKEDSDKKGDVCKVVDAIINPRVADNLQSDPQLCAFFVQLLQGHCLTKYKIDIEDKYSLPKLKYKGKSIEFQRVKGKKAPKIQQLSEEDIKQQDLIEKSGKRLIQEINESRPSGMPGGAIPQPKWSLYIGTKKRESAKCEETEYDGDFDINAVRYLKLKVEMPVLVTGQHAQIDVSDSARVRIQNGKYYALALQLPLPVVAAKTKAIFTKKNRVLILKFTPHIAVNNTSSKTTAQNAQAIPTSETATTASATPSVRTSAQVSVSLSNDMLDDLV